MASVVTTYVLNLPQTAWVAPGIADVPFSAPGAGLYPATDLYPSTTLYPRDDH